MAPYNTLVYISLNKWPFMKDGYTPTFSMWWNNIKSIVWQNITKGLLDGNLISPRIDYVFKEMYGTCKIGLWTVIVIED